MIRLWFQTDLSLLEYKNMYKVDVCLQPTTRRLKQTSVWYGWPLLGKDIHFLLVGAHQKQSERGALAFLLELGMSHESAITHPRAKEPTWNNVDLAEWEETWPHLLSTELHREKIWCKRRNKEWEKGENEKIKVVQKYMIIFGAVCCYCPREEGDLLLIWERLWHLVWDFRLNTVINRKAVLAVWRWFFNRKSEKQAWWSSVSFLPPSKI